MNRSFPEIFRLENIALSLAIILIAVNLFFTGVYIRTKIHYPYPFYYEPGYQFNKFKSKLKGVKEIGYLTNKDLSREKNDGIFLQAQYFLAPTILKMNDPNHVLNILDYSNQVFLFYQIKSLHAIPLVDDLYGQVLILRQK